jgi:hypothetical protein
MSDLIEEYERKIQEGDDILADDPEEEEIAEMSLNEKELLMIDQMIEIEKDSYKMRMDLLEGFKEAIESAIEQENEIKNEKEEEEEMPESLFPESDL